MNTLSHAAQQLHANSHTLAGNVNQISPPKNWLGPASTAANARLDEIHTETNTVHGLIGTIYQQASAIDHMIARWS